MAEPIDDGGKRFIDVVDPDSGNGFRFFEIEYSLACAMDGARDIAGIQRWAREELGLEPSAAEVATVISTLGDLGYLEGTAPTSVAADEPELAPGVVAARPTAAPASFADVELGTAGAAPPRAVEDLPAVDDFELGTAGGVAHHASAPPITDGPELGPSGDARMMEFDAPTPPPAAMPTATMRPSSRPDAEDDGPTNLPKPQSIADEDEVSVDLADHLAVSASDVKEAVRASKVMSAVDVPKDVLDQLEASETAARETAEREAAAREQAAREAAAREVAAREAEAREAAARDAAARDAAAREAAAREAAAREAASQAAREQAGRPVADLPQIPVGVSKKKPGVDAPKDGDKAVAATPVEPPKAGTSKALVFVLVLVLLLAGAFVVWTKVLKKPLPWEKSDDGQAATPTKPTQPTPPTPPPPPPPPPAPTAALTEKPGDVSNVVAGQIGVVAFVAADGAQVAVGDELLRFSASPADEKKLTGLDNDLNVRYPKQLKDATAARDKAQAAGNAGAQKAAEAKMAEVQKKIDARTAERDALRAKLDGLTIKAPIAGVVKLEGNIAKGARTTADQAVATVTGPASLIATFTIPTGGKTYSQDASVMVSAKDQKANCTATSVDGPTVIVTCPADAGIAAGTMLTLE
ncbi:MAG: hypothetical protein JNK64_17725 [Myxococcales bacterium]|nr:hypothetical protein [Myxococcales bacterium]